MISSNSIGRINFEIDNEYNPFSPFFLTIVRFLSIILISSNSIGKINFERDNEYNPSNSFFLTIVRSPSNIMILLNLIGRMGSPEKEYSPYKFWLLTVNPYKELNSTRSNFMGMISFLFDSEYKNTPCKFVSLFLTIAKKSLFTVEGSKHVITSRLCFLWNRRDKY